MKTNTVTQLHSIDYSFSDYIRNTQKVEASKEFVCNSTVAENIITQLAENAEIYKNSGKAEEHSGEVDRFESAGGVKKRTISSRT